MQTLEMLETYPPTAATPIIVATAAGRLLREVGGPLDPTRRAPAPQALYLDAW
jgi:hypothetical protein